MVGLLVAVLGGPGQLFVPLGLLALTRMLTTANVFLRKLDGLENTKRNGLLRFMTSYSFVFMYILRTS